MSQETFTIPNISCGHCTATIETELNQLAGVSHVSSDVKTQKVTVTFDAPATTQQLIEKLKAINYPSKSE